MRATATLDRVEATTWRRCAPPPRLRVSEWADRYRILSTEASAEPGRWRTARVPYLAGIMDAVGDRAVETIVFKKPAQCGGSEGCLNVLGHALHLDPGPAMVLQPTLELARAFSKDRLAPMLRDTPVLRGLIREPRAKDADNTLLHKRATSGAVLTIAGANSPASLASRPIRLLFADEVDRYPASVGAEGDPLALAIKRTTTFRRRKVLIVSTPTVKGISRVDAWYEISDQRRYEIPCPHCDTFHALEWANLTWTDREPATAHFVCPHCRGRIDDHERPALLRAGRWRATAPFAGIAGFHCWDAYAPWRSLADIVAGFLAARRSIETLRVWRNTSMAECWEEPGEQADPTSLLARREGYVAEVPAGVVCLTCGVDTQDDRLEVLLVGWGIGEESWVIARETLPGDPARPEVWAQLDELLLRAWRHELGLELRVLSTCIDSAGHRTQAVYTWVMPRQPRRVHATIGRTGGSHQLISPPRPIRPASGSGTVLLRVVDVDQAKSLLMSRLRLTERGREYVHLPMTVDEEFCAQLTAEKLVTRRDNGAPVRRWEKTRARNEALDAAVLALAALRLVATPKILDEWAQQVSVAAGAARDASGAPVLARPTAPPRRFSRSTYLDDGRV